MDFINLIIAPLIVASVLGLGWLSYKHPLITRKLLKYLTITSSIFMFLILFWHICITSSYSRSISAAYYKVPIKENYNLNIDSLYSTISDRDSIDLIIVEHKRQMLLAVEESLKSNIVASRIRALKDEEDNMFKNYISLGVFVFFIIIVLYILTYIFESLHGKETL